MSSILISRRSFALRMALLPVGLGAATRVLAAPNGMGAAAPADGEGLSHSAEAIHQEIVFNARRRRVYQALTNAKQFDALTRLSDAADTVMAPGAKPTAISPEVGGSFTFFGGYITGWNLELLPDERLVQAWRAASWAPGDYSVTRFALFESGVGTKLVFDHRGFPDGQGTHLASGWHSNYWEPLTKFLSRG